jgi:hypothetical protein
MKDKWKLTLTELVVLEFVLSVIFLSLSYIFEANINYYYFKGVGVGLLIAWVTGGLAYFVVNRRKEKK